jgi:hypothetical protein
MIDGSLVDNAFTPAFSVMLSWSQTIASVRRATEPGPAGQGPSPKCRSAKEDLFRATEIASQRSASYTADRHHTSRGIAFNLDAEMWHPSGKFSAKRGILDWKTFTLKASRWCDPLLYGPGSCDVGFRIGRFGKLLDSLRPRGPRPAVVPGKMELVVSSEESRFGGGGEIDEKR